MIAASLAALAFLTIGSAPPSDPTTTTVVVPTTTPSTEPIPEGFVPVIDSTNSIVVAVPAAWADVDTAPAPTEGAGEVPFIAVSPDLAAFYTGFEVPGVLYAAFPHTDDLLAYLDQFGMREGCAAMEVREYSDPEYLGIVQIGVDCGPHHMIWNMVLANPVDNTHYTAVVQVQSANDNERRTILRTFNEIPGSPVFQTTTVPSSTAVPTTTMATTTTT